MSLAFFAVALLLVPFNGALVRYRLAYSPKETRVTDLEVGTPRPEEHLDADAKQAAKASGGPVTETPTSDAAVTTADKSTSNTTSDLGTSSGPEGLMTTGESSAVIAPRPTLSGIVTSVRRVEGNAGLFKGLLPTLLVDFVLIPISHRIPRLYLSPSPSIANKLPQSLINTLFYSVVLVWVYRAIATRSKLEIFGTSAKDGIRALFTHYERAGPWRIYSSGLLWALLPNILLHVFVLRPLRNLIEPDRSRQPLDGIYYLQGAAMVLLILFSTVVFAPLDVIVTRLAAQRNFGEVPVATETSDGQEQTGEDTDADARPEWIGQPEVANVAFRLRADSDLEPYNGVYDCAKKIIEEEGWGVLYLGWFITFLGKLFTE